MLEDRNGAERGYKGGISADGSLSTSRHDWDLLPDVGLPGERQLGNWEAEQAGDGGCAGVPGEPGQCQTFPHCVVVALHCPAGLLQARASAVREARGECRQTNGARKPAGPRDPLAEPAAAAEPGGEQEHGRPHQRHPGSRANIPIPATNTNGLCWLGWWMLADAETADLCPGVMRLRTEVREPDWSDGRNLSNATIIEY